MKITSIKLENVRGFKETDFISLSDKINLFIGANNAGKSTILNAIFMLQRQGCLTNTDIMIGETEAQISFQMIGSHLYIGSWNKLETYVIKYTSALGPPQSHKILSDGKIMSHPYQPAPEVEPNNLIYPYLSKRKVNAFSNGISEYETNSVQGSLSNLSAKIDRLITPQFQPANTEYLDACYNILGFVVSTYASSNGKQAVYFIHNSENIPLSAMGEGVSNILGLIVDLCIAENKIFLIEEPENDIHPKALKALLNLIIKKSESNQFFISTHSNIVMKYLGGVENAKIFNITNEESDPIKPKLFYSKINEVSNDPVERIKILEDLGYDFFDFGMWKGWLFLEESSAEVLIREWFITWFTPSLKDKLRTYSAGSTSQVESKFEDFNRLFVYLHLEPTYKNKVWVIIDSGVEENNIINKLKETYTKSGWSEENFSQFDEHDFESYYPERFKDEVDAIAILKKKDKREPKKILLDKVKDWIKANQDIAKKEFEKSASNVITKLQEIEQKL